MYIVLLGNEYFCWNLIALTVSIVSEAFCLLIAFANIWDPDQGQQNMTALLKDFLKDDFEQKLHTTKIMQNYQALKELNLVQLGLDWQLVKF